MEDLFVVYGRSLPVLKGDVPIPSDGIGKSGGISERQESHGRAAHAEISFGIPWRTRAALVLGPGLRSLGFDLPRRYSRSPCFFIVSSLNIRSVQSVGTVFLSLTSIHIRTLSTGGVHPLTRTSGAIPFPPNSGGFYLHIHGDLLCSLESAHILVWNWKTGELRVEIASPSPLCAY